ncbi:hypothetical protein HPB51_019373 [Rhipicephalus microplus]|uniref:Ig-like domain-containing protein n=1 Tax=Rhipicephalus microplus TaxID=6941 RepID=A0A9J6DBH2_RHIMP|nr:hypothetical protein HPB51_019373 [Rhipicephalus microplus]
MIMRDAVVKGSGSFDHLGFFNGAPKSEHTGLQHFRLHWKCHRRSWDSNPRPAAQVQQVLALPGSQARLPCDLGGLLSASGLEPSLISWTHGPSASAEPLYSVVRAEGVTLVQADHRVTPAWKERFHFSVSRGTLSLTDVSPRDAGIYVCRVRFQHATERTSRVELIVVERPGIPVLNFDPETPGGDRLREGKRLRVLCEVVGGKPRPSLRWSLSLSGGLQPTPLEATEGSSDGRDGVTRSWATLDKLQRWHHEARLTCQAFNSELVASPSSSLRLQLERESFYGLRSQLEKTVPKVYLERPFSYSSVL